MFTTKEGYEIKIIDCGSRKGYCTVQIEEWITEKQYADIEKGNVKYPYHRSVYSIGYIGEGEYKVSINRKLTKVYETWRGILARCYDEKTLKKQPTYRDVTVHNDWHNFQNFAKWFYKESNYKKGWYIDKDILSKENKIYSSETCAFIPVELNSFMANNQDLKKSTSEYTGVYFSKRYNKFVAEIQADMKTTYLGTFSNTPFGEKRAAVAYIKKRRIEVEKIKIKYRDVLPEKVVNNIR